MPVTPETLRILLERRARINGDVDHATGELVRAWARLWNELANDWSLATEELVALGAGRPSRAQVQRVRRVRTALLHTRDALEDLANLSESVIVVPLQDLIQETAAWEARLMLSQYPPVAQTVTLTMAFNRVDPAAIAAIITRSTQKVTGLLRPLAPDAYAAVLSELVRGVALGTNPKTAARQMLRRTRGAFDGGLSRATRIARTEILDAHRTAAAAHHAEHSDVLTGWRWAASLSPRTCPACLSLNGSLHPVAAPGPQGHVNCRCTRVPVTKTWKQLGFAIEEPEDVFPDAQSWFESLPPAEQVRIMGPTRLRLLQSGDLSWDDLAMRIQNPGWRPSYQARPLRDLRRDGVKTA